MKKTAIRLTSIAMMVVAVCLTVSCSSGTLQSVLGTLGSGGTIANAFTSVIGLDKITKSGLTGTWKYDGPGCAFTSKNLLAKAGGEVAATKVEQELKPYFDKTGLSSSNTSITFNDDGTFKATVAGSSFSGQWTLNEDDAKVTLKTMLLSFNCYAKREYGGIALLFESKKLLTVLQTLATLSGNDTAQKVAELSKNYEGIRLGFDMKK